MASRNGHSGKFRPGFGGNFSPNKLDRLSGLSELPSPRVFYEHFSGLPKLIGKGLWVRAVCPFHTSHTNSAHLAINLEIGCFVCHSCGAKGGSLVAFHAQNVGLSFNEALKDLLRSYR